MVLIIIGMQIIGLYFTNSLERDLVGNFKNSIESQVAIIDTRIKEINDDVGDNRAEMYDQIQTLLADYGNRPDIEEIRYINADNVLIGTSRISNESLVGSRINDKLSEDALNSGIVNDEIFVNVDKDNQRVWILNQPLIIDDEVVGVIYVESNIESVYVQLESINNIFIIATFFSLVITSILGIFVARTITKPITDMRNQALLMSEGDYTSRVQIYSDDEIGQLAGSFNILSKRVQEAQANTESEKKRLDSVITHMSDGIIATDRKGRIRIVNDMAIGMMNLDISAEDLQGQDMLEILKLGEDLSLENIIQEANESHLIFIDTQEGVITLRVNFSAIVTDTGFINGYIAVLHDVTEQERINAERREFVANVSHELRTPLTSMRSYLEALQEGAWKDEEIAPKFLSVTKEETDRMSRLVEDLLQLSRMDNEAEEIQTEVVDFKLFINRIIDRFEMTHKDDVIFTRHIPDAPLFTDISVDKMGQVLDNVLSNAIKYQHGNPKRVDIHLKQNTLYNRMTVRIKDYGLGIPSNKVERIFERFYRVDKGRARKMGGTGLGLAITKEIVEAHNGKIWANSVENEGTTIFINLPCEVIEEDEWDV